MPPLRHLPSIWALRVFESAGRLGSLKLAAAELHVTPSAVSRQVQILEHDLGVSLFRRLPRGLALTERGAHYLTEVSQALLRLDTASSRLRETRQRLRLSVLQSFAGTWLLPRIVRFEKAHPQIEVEMEATTAFVDFARDDVDVAIRFGLGGWPDLHVEALLPLEVFPVCRPGLLQGNPPAPAELAGQTWLASVHVPDGWALWLQGAGVVDVVPRRTVSYDNAQLILDAALAGQGVALMPALLAHPLLAAGRLVRPFPQAITSPYTYHLVCRPRSLDEPHVRAFRDWLVTEMAAWCAEAGAGEAGLGPPQPSVRKSRLSRTRGAP